MKREAFAAGQVVLAFFICQTAFAQVWNSRYWGGDTYIYDYRAASPGSLPDASSLMNSNPYPGDLQSDYYLKPLEIPKPYEQPSLDSYDSLLNSLKNRPRRW